MKKKRIVEKKNVTTEESVTNKIGEKKITTKTKETKKETLEQHGMEGISKKIIEEEKNEKK